MPSTTDWRGLSPLKSTRTDVERTLGRPDETLEGPTSVVTAGNVVNFKADVQPDSKMTLVWTVSDGKIIDQAGRHISLDTTGLGGNSVKVTVQGRGSCSVENSFTLNIQGKQTFC